MIEAEERRLKAQFHAWQRNCIGCIGYAICRLNHGGAGVNV